MSARDHSKIEEFLAVRALGGLDGDDVAALEAALAAHGPECAECRRLETEFAETAGHLAFALTPVPADDTGAERILRIAAEEPPLTRPIRIQTGRRRRPRWVAAIAVAAVIAVAVVAIAVVRPTGTQQVSASWSQEVVPFEGSPGRLAMAFTPGQPGVVLFGSDLPDPGPGHTYEVWTIRGQVAASAGCQLPTDGSLAAFLDADPNGADLVAVTIEPARCPSQPTTAPVYTAQPVAT
jgi:Anti-sigma-K factor rskA, C-terminal